MANRKQDTYFLVQSRSKSLTQYRFVRLQGGIQSKISISLHSKTVSDYTTNGRVRKVFLMMLVLIGKKRHHDKQYL